MRRITQLQIEDRGTLKNFEIKEMGALQLEHWAIRAGRMLLATDILTGLDIDAIQSSADLPQIVGKIVAGGAFSKLAKVDMEEYKKLEAEILQTVSIVQPNGTRMKLTPATIDGNVEDYRAIAKLVFEAVKFNLNFSSPAPQKPANTGRKPSISLHS